MQLLGDLSNFDCKSLHHAPNNESSLLIFNPLKCYSNKATTENSNIQKFKESKHHFIANHNHRPDFIWVNKAVIKLYTTYAYYNICLRAP